MTDATQSLREVIGRATGEGRLVATEKQKDAIMAGLRLARFITGEAAEEALARMIYPWGFDVDGPQADDTSDRLRAREQATSKARAILEVISRAALGEG